MQVYSVPLTSDNLPACVPLWGGAETYAPHEMDQVLDGASQLLAERRALGAIVLEDERVRAFGMTTFAEDALINQYMAEPHPHLGKRLLLDARTPHSGSVLSPAQIAERNADTGLQMIVANTGYDPEAQDPDTVIGVLMWAFQKTHRGYRIARIVNEVFGEPAISIVTGSRSYEVLRVFDLEGGRELRSLVGTLTREQAVALKHPLLAMFAYSPPRLFFTPAEQELLSAALRGATDDALSKRLGIPMSAVKARWTRIQERAARMAPELFEKVPLPLHRGRGVQTRHLILQYVRHHPSELTPYSRTRARAPQNGVPSAARA